MPVLLFLNRHWLKKTTVGHFSSTTSLFILLSKIEKKRKAVQVNDYRIFYFLFLKLYIK